MKSTKIIINSLFIAIFFTAFAYAADALSVGVVNFGTCIEKSYLGKEEKEKLDSLRNEMIAVLEQKQKDFQEVAEKLNNPDYMDTISQDAEAKLQEKAQQLSQELQMISQQTQQALQQAEMKMYQTIRTQINKASEYIAREKNLDFILDEMGTFYCKRPADITQLVISELNRHFQPTETQEISSGE
jgi:outer membrane protein